MFFPSLQLVYVDRFKIMERMHPRLNPIVTGWTNEDLKKREKEEIENGGFGQGCMIEAPNFNQQEGKRIADNQKGVNEKEGHGKGEGIEFKVIEIM